jgi:Cu(I)/Ag(I) efflux system membrane fusion protein
MQNDKLAPTASGNRGIVVRAARWTLYAAIPVAAAVLAYVATRGSAKAPAAAQHDHAATTSAPGAQPVMLSAEAAQRIGVTYAVAAVVPLGREIRTVGQVTLDETRVRTVSLKIDGWVEQLHVNFSGQSVDSGTPLLAIYSPMLVSAQEELLLAKRLAAEVAGGAPEARANAMSLLSSARRRLAYWDVPADDIARVESSGQVERTLTLRAPVSGFVVEKNVFQGQRVMAGDALYRIADLSRVWVEGEVFERDLSSVRLGQSVITDVEAMPGTPLRGSITYVNPTLNPDTRTTRVRVELANPGLRLKPGMYATLRWTGGGLASALSVPRSAVVSTGERNLVFVKRRDGMLEPRLVELGMATDERVQILRGLVAGDSVVASATFLVDAESNLGTVLGGMGNMPGMDMTAPKKPE